ncbi:MAG: galactokinase [Clostridia bacterium]|nr:galactokinase [Clostridia bacterium]
MNQYASLKVGLTQPEAVEQLKYLYGSQEGTLVRQAARYAGLLDRHEELFHAQSPVHLISAPGRMEIGGNHTDHNRGKVLAASASLDTLAAVTKRDDTLVHLHSEGYAPICIDLSDLEKHTEEEGTTASLIRGVAAGMARAGYKVGGFDAVVTSSVVSGSGLSSSAAFEVMVCAILDRLYNDGNMDFKESAKISQFAENVYFGKPSGLLDQMASAAGGLVGIDFKDEDPVVTRLAFDFQKKSYYLVVVATGGSHADLTDYYASIPTEMKQVAACLGQQVLRQIRPEEFDQAIPTLRAKVSDRAILRAKHFYHENERVDRQIQALQEENLPKFFEAITESGYSSFMYLQNVYADPTKDQSLSVALALAEEQLQGKGAWRIHGGGFAGTTLNFVSENDLNAFVRKMEAVFGEGSCHILNIRPVGAYELKL